MDQNLVLHISRVFLGVSMPQTKHVYVDIYIYIYIYIHPHYVSDLSKFDALLHKTQQNPSGIRYQGLTCVNP